ncbi:MAG: ABC transporter ATP-binding protein [Beijerinckiaceae bacterium]|jgi:branched-chain amino acid transport system ATP-binding protein|nr:ABC transporter ATP-binding protein [Beijerinckiaceae bacterium]
MAEPALELRDLNKAYGALTVTDHVSLALPDGEFHAIIGPNGAGKTTLIHQISGLVPSDSGSVWLGGRDVTGLSLPERVHRGLVRSFQITSILPGFSALENVALAVQAREGSSFRFFGRARDEARLNDPAMQALEEVGLGKRAGVRAGLLSHGEKRQLEIAIALAAQPRVLLLDEPLAGTGPEESAVLIALMQRLRGRMTILLIEHDMEAVFALAERVSVLVYGRIIASGPPAAVRDDPDVRTAYLGEEGG